MSAIRLYHGTKELFVQRGGFAELDPDRVSPSGQLGGRFYLTPVVEVAAWFALHFGRLARLPPCVLVFDVPWKEYEELCQGGAVLAHGFAPYGSRMWGEAALVPPLNEAAAIIAPIADFEHLAHFVQVAIHPSKMKVLTPLLASACENRLRPDDSAFQFRFPPHWRVS